MTDTQIKDFVLTSLNYSFTHYSTRERKSLGSYIEYVYGGMYYKMKNHEDDRGKLLKVFNSMVLEYIAKGIEQYDL